MLWSWFVSLKFSILLNIEKTSVNSFLTSLLPQNGNLKSKKTSKDWKTPSEKNWLLRKSFFCTSTYKTMVYDQVRMGKTIKIWPILAIYVSCTDSMCIQINDQLCTFIQYWLFVSCTDSVIQNNDQLWVDPIISS